MRRIALAILASAITLALAVPAHADGWTGWKTFALHNGVVLEWRTYSHPEHNTKADWRVTNNTTKVLYHLWLGQRTYSCENGYTESFVSSAFSGIEGKELNPDLSAIFSTDNETLDYLGADIVDRAYCPNIAEAAFYEGISKALEFAVEPLEPVKPWMEHTFSARESTELVATCKVGTIQGIPQEACIEHAYESESSRIAFRNECRSEANSEYLTDGLCPKKGAGICVYPAREQIGGKLTLYVYDIPRFLDIFWKRESRRGTAISEEEYLHSVCVGNLGGTYMGLQ